MTKQHMLINFIAFQFGWFACVLGAANGLPLLGPVVAVLVVILHLKLARQPRRELSLVMVAGVIGAVFDSALVASGWLIYPNGILLAGTAPYWIIAMWLLFATTLNVAMRWLRGNALLAFVLGAIAGPMSYWGGARLGALEFASPAQGMIALSIGWALMMPLLMHLSKRLDGIQPQLEAGYQNA